MSSYMVTQLVAKMKAEKCALNQHVDQDFRFMALSDLINETRKPHFNIDSQTEGQVVEQVSFFLRTLALFQDPNTEVKNQAVKAIGALVCDVSQKRLLYIVDQLIAFSAHPRDDQLRDIANLGLRTVVREIKSQSTLSAAICTKLVPKLLDQIRDANSTQDMQLNSIEVLLDVYIRFQTDLQAQDILQSSAIDTLVLQLSNTRPAMRKRAVEAIARVVAATPIEPSLLMQKLIRETIVPGVVTPRSFIDSATAISLIGTVALHASSKMEAAIESDTQIVPHVIAKGKLPATDNYMDEDADSHQITQESELREAVCLTLERLLLKCPKAMNTHIEATTSLAVSLVSWDPNFAGASDDDEEEMDQDTEDTFDDDYSDDEDMSWKVRRAAARVLGAAIETRPDLLSIHCLNIAPVLMSRFSERVESVRLEIWSTYVRLLNVVKLLHSLPLKRTVGSPREDTPETRKRKRSNSPADSMIALSSSEDSPVQILQRQSSNVIKALLKHINTKQITLAQAGFTLLDSLLSVLGGGLDELLSMLAGKCAIALPASSSVNPESATGASTTLKLTVLSYLNKLFECHSPALFIEALQTQLLPGLLVCMADKFNKVASAAFDAASALLRSIRPLLTAAVAQVDSHVIGLVGSIADATTKSLADPTTDSEVRYSAVICLGCLLSHCGSVVLSHQQLALELLRDSLKREATRGVTMRTVAQLASSTGDLSSELIIWVNGVISDVAVYLGQSNRSIRIDAFACLPPLINKAGPALDKSIIDSLISAMSSGLVDDDLLIVPMALSALSTLANAIPADTLAAPSFADATLPQVFKLVDSPILQPGVALDNLLQFFTTIVLAGSQPGPLIAELKKSRTRTAPRCIGTVARASPEIVTKIAQEAARVAAAPQSNSLLISTNLLILGEVGRLLSLIEAEKAFQVAFAHFKGSGEVVRSSAAFAAGNLAVGNPDLLHHIIQLVTTNEAPLSIISLDAMREFITHSSAEALSTRASELWSPLFSVCSVDGPPPAEPIIAGSTAEELKQREKRIDMVWKENEQIREQWKQSETSRSMAAECLGKISLTDPARFLPQLQSRISDHLAGNRTATVSAVRFTLTDNAPDYDLVLAPMLPAFLSLIEDQNLDVRRSALTTLNAAAHHKPHCIKPHLGILMPLLYKETEVNASLIRTVEMGPFKHRVDDGLEVRKAAYETCYTLLDTCLARLDVRQLLESVQRGLNDDNEIRAICYLMINRLASVSPAVVLLKLDAVTDSFTGILNMKLKDTAVKQEQEKHQQIQKAALRAFAALSHLATASATPKFANALKLFETSPWASELADLRSKKGKVMSNEIASMDID